MPPRGVMDRLRPLGAGSPGGLVILSSLAVAVLVIYAVPLGAVVVTVARGAAEHGPGPLLPSRASLALLSMSIGWASLVASIALVAAWPAAVWAAASPGRAAVLFFPMLVPTYLAYAGWGQLRAPGTVIGRWLLTAPAPAGDPGMWPMLASRVQAVGGLAMWAWPIAAGVLVIGLTRVRSEAYDALAMEPTSRLRRLGVMVSMHRWWVLAAFVTVVLIMLGSAVPMHLAQLQTHAMSTWLALASSGEGERWAVWGRAWPILVLVLAGGVVWSGSALGLAEAAPRGGPRSRAGWRGGVIVLGLILLSVAAPAALFAWSMSHARALGDFWRANSGAVATSLVVGLVTGWVAMLWTTGVWWMFSGGGRARVLAGTLLCVSVITALFPGVIIGTAVALTWRSALVPEAVSDSIAPVMVAHLARFGFVSMLTALWLARGEPQSLRDIRRLEAGHAVGVWARTALAWRWPAVLAAGVAVGVLSLHEIEAALFVLPAGTGNLAYQMLQLLHQGRDDALAAGVLIVMGMVVLPAGLAWIGWEIRTRKNPR